MSPVAPDPNASAPRCAGQSVESDESRRHGGTRTAFRARPKWMRRPASRCSCSSALPILWLLLGSILSVIGSFKLVLPGILTNVPYLTTGRVLPAAENAFAYGWAASAAIGAGLWILARLVPHPAASRRHLVHRLGSLESRPDSRTARDPPGRRHRLQAAGFPDVRVAVGLLLRSSSSASGPS